MAIWVTITTCVSWFFLCDIMFHTFAFTDAIEISEGAWSRHSIIVELSGHGKLSMRIAKNTLATILRLLDPAKMIPMILMVLTLQPPSKPPLWTPASDRSRRAPPRPTTPPTAICVQMDVQVVLPFVAPVSTRIASIPQ